MLTPYLPYPPSSGGQIRSFNLIKKLSEKHRITLYSLIKNDDERQYIPHLQKFCEDVKVFNRAKKPWTLSNILKTGFSLYPFVVIRNMSASEKEDVSQLLTKEQFDIIHAETFYVCPQIPETSVPVVLVDQTIEYQVYQHYVTNHRLLLLKPLLWIDVLKIKFWESYYWKKAARTIAVSESDSKKMRQIVPGLCVSIVPNGVGEDLMEKVPLHFSKTLLFMSNYNWMQNVEAAKILVEKVFPKIKEQVPDARLLIAGQYAEKIADLKGDGVEIMNLQNEDIQGVKDAYQKSGLLVAPLYGPGGTRLKILAAMGANLPVVTTPIGIEGIEAVDGESVFVGKTPQELAKLVVKVLGDKKLYASIAQNARKLVEDKYSYEAIADNLDKVYQEVKRDEER